MDNHKSDKKNKPFYEKISAKKDKQDKLMEVTSKYFQKKEYKSSFLKDLQNRTEEYPSKKGKSESTDNHSERYRGKYRENDEKKGFKSQKEWKEGLDFASFLKTKGANVYVKDIANPEVQNDNQEKSSPRRTASEQKRGNQSDKNKVQQDKEIIRLNKFIAQSGICSRRKAAELVKEGSVTVNGQTETNPAYEVQPDDIIKYNGKQVKPEEKMVYLLMNKPRNVITTASDEKGRKTVLDMVRDKVDVRVFPVGRLDRNTTGLLLITNDGELATKLSHPSNRVKKIYHVTLDKNLKLKDLEAIREGLVLEDGVAEVDSIEYIKDGGKNEVGIEIHIGKNRIVRRIFEHLGYEVERLDRIYYAGLTKKDLPRGWSRPLTKQEIIMLKHFTN